jgi:hypothetical protein
MVSSVPAIAGEVGSCRSRRPRRTRATARRMNLAPSGPAKTRHGAVASRRATPPPPPRVETGTPPSRFPSAARSRQPRSWLQEPQSSSPRTSCRCCTGSGSSKAACTPRRRASTGGPCSGGPFRSTFELATDVVVVSPCASSSPNPTTSSAPSLPSGAHAIRPPQLERTNDAFSRATYRAPRIGLPASTLAPHNRPAKPGPNPRDGAASCLTFDLDHPNPLALTIRLDRRGAATLRVLEREGGGIGRRTSLRC